MGKRWIIKLIPARLRQLLKNALREILFEELKQFFNKEEPLLSTEQVVFEFGFCKRTLYNWRKKRKFPYYKFPKGIYYKKSEILEAFKVNKKGGIS